MPDRPAARLVDLWEAGRLQPLYRRALLLLEVACPQLPADHLADMPIGQRDGLLLGLREQLFGPQLTAVASCPRCAERLDLNFTVRDILTDPPVAGALQVNRDGYQVEFRLPTIRDLAAVAQAGAAAAGELLTRCVTLARHNDTICRTAELPTALTDAIVAGMAAADPQADVRLALCCPSCGHTWQAPFDIVSYLWGEIESWALRTLGEVHVLARAYGWSEPEVLGLSEFRRKYYLGLAVEH